MSLRKKPASLWKWLAAVVACLSFVVVFSCNTPFIPIPPPDPTFSQDSSGEWAVSTPPDSRAMGSIFYIYNESLGTGVMQRAAADGSMYARPLQGQEGDYILIHWEQRTGESSSTICRPLGVGLVRIGCQ
jgi:hypothetical protein